MNLLKKLTAIAIALILTVSLVGCGGKTTEEDLLGTWKIDSIEYEGSKFSLDEWKTMEDEDLSQFVIVIKEGGKAYIYDGEYGDLVDWIFSEDVIMIDGEKGTIVDDRICLEHYSDKLYLVKHSDSQEIPSEETTTQKTTTTKQTTTKEKTTKAESTVEWREFLAEYEEWVDDYVEICKKYKDNPADMSILSDYTEMMTELTEWSQKTEDMELSITDTDEALEYSQELIRIAGKMAEAAE